MVKRLLSEGLLGRLYHVRVRGLGTDYADPDTPLHWRQDAFLSGMHLAATLAGIVALVAASVAWRLLPQRRPVAVRAEVFEEALTMG